VDAYGYMVTGLTKGRSTSLRKVHQLVSEAFLDHVLNGHEQVVNHKNFNRTDNRLKNLEIVSNRENSNRKHLPSTSKYVGVVWGKSVGKWKSQITLNKKTQYHLGYFEDEEEAAKAYEVILFLHNKGFKFKSAKQCREVLRNDWVKLPFNDTEPFFIIAA